MRRARLAFPVALALCLLIAAPATSHAGLAPHEVLVLVNNRSPRSLEVANHFVHIRRIPSRNVVYLDVPEYVLAPRSQITPQDFTRHIWEPTQQAMEERGIEDQILAWIYSVDFPIRLTTTPPLSLMGITFLRNEPPDDMDRMVARAGYLSPLFAGPDSPDGNVVVGGSLINYKEALGDRAPLPSMMLGFCGSRGTDVDTVIRTLQYGQIADRTAPRGTVYWITSDDVRSTARQWQIGIAQNELRPLNIRTAVGTDLEPDYPGIIGMQLGAADLDVTQIGRHLPGSMAEHMTSHAAEFDLHIQTKMTDWLRAGATATAGTVTEPYSLWPKFPHARFFAHYARGHTMLESFFLSLRSPTQILLLGEPLTRPWAPRLNMSLVAIEGHNPFKGPASFMAIVMPELPNVRLQYRILVNGELVSASASAGNTFSFDTRDLADGYHELRAVSYIQGMIVHTAMDRLQMEVNNKGRAVRITAPEPRASLDLYSSLTLNVESDGEPVRLELIHNERVLATRGGASGPLTVEASVLGAGPVTLHVRATYDDDMVVRSVPLELTITKPAQHPALAALTDNTQRRSPDWTKLTVPDGALQRSAGGVYRLTPNDAKPFDLCVFNEPAARPANLSARMTIPADRADHPATEQAGLIFNHQDAQNFNYFIVNGNASAWAFGTCRDGVMEHRVQRGALILRATAHEIDLLFNGPSVSAYVNGQPIATWTDPSIAEPGRTGLLAKGRAIDFERVQLLAVQSTEETNRE